MVVPIRHRTTRNRYQHCFIRSSQRTSPFELDFVLQHPLYPTLPIARPYIAYRRFTHPVRLRDPFNRPALGALEQNMRSSDIARIRFPPPDKPFDFLPFVLAQFDHGYTPCFSEYSSPPTT